MTRFTPLLLAFATAITALPAAADPGRFGLGEWMRDRPQIEPGTGISHNVEGRFGVAHIRDSEGNSETIPMVGLRYTATFRHQLDNGWRVAFAVGVEASNYANFGRHDSHYRW